MKRFYLTGHHTFSNRGCEAIVRSTVRLLRERFGNVKVLVPSSDIPSDSRQWPEASTLGVEFVPAYLPSVGRYWLHLQRRLPIPLLKRAGWPFPMPAWVKKTIAEADCVLAVGGDNYSLDYLLPTLWMGLDQCAMNMGKPVVLWGASVGPFEQEPHFLPVIRRHLSRMAFIAARESITVDYLSSMGLGDEVIQTADPAFVLEPQKVDTTPFWPKEAGRGVLGLNISPLLLRYRSTEQSREELMVGVTDFIRDTITRRRLSVLLIPHVIPHRGVTKNNDAVFMARFVSRLQHLEDYLRLMDDGLNAAQTKYVISRCRFFVGARTHSTIAAISSEVPTISIAYSIKARGINRDIFGDDRYVMKTPEVSCSALTEQLDRLMAEEDILRDFLAEQQNYAVKQARLPARKLMEELP